MIFILVIHAVILVLGVLALSKSARAGAVIYVTGTFVHALLFSALDSIYYYVTAAMCDSIALIMLSSVRPVCCVVYRLAVLLLLAIISNAVGAVLWFAYLPPTVYDWAITGLYISVLFVVLDGGVNEMGSPRDDGVIPRVGLFSPPSCTSFFKNKG